MPPPAPPQDTPRPEEDSHEAPRETADPVGRPEPVVGFDPEELVGFRIGVTAHRRSADLIAALERRGAEILHAPTLRIVPAEQDDRLIAATAAVIRAVPDLVLVTTGYGLRGWLESADAAGQGPDLLDVLSRARILVRGPKARGAVRANGLLDDGMSAEETTESLVDQVLAEGATGRTIAIQLHGFVDEEQLDRLRAAGASVITVAPYLWTGPEEPQRVVRLLDAIAGRTLDAVTFTSAPAAEAMLAAARERGQFDAVVAAMRADVVPFAVGPVTAAPLHAVGVDAVHPDRYRLGALVRTLCEYLVEHQVRRVPTRHGVLEIRGRSAVLGGQRVTLSPTSVAVLRLLADAGGAVVPKARLQEVLADSEDDHALEVAIARLRQVLPHRALIATVIKRGYRLDV
jgi:uroporphyrinogen-III synthase